MKIAKLRERIEKADARHTRLATAAAAVLAPYKAQAETAALSIMAKGRKSKKYKNAVFACNRAYADAMTLRVALEHAVNAKKARARK